MKISKERWSFKDEYYGPFLPYVQNENVTDINYNGRETWIDDLTVGRYKADIELTKEFISQFTVRIADVVSEKFNQYCPLLEAETETLRISIIHDTVTNTGITISIRKTPVIRRLNEQKIINEEYCSQEMLDFLANCVRAKLNILVCGLPGTGKTELLKFLTKYIPPTDRAITIEDSLEIHYAQINEGCDSVELKVDNNFTYETALKACLRQNPQWILLSEARSSEVKYLIESMSTGTHCLTTIHTDDVRKVPDRVKNMIQDSHLATKIENDVYSFLDLAVLVKKTMRNGHIYRYIDQICCFSRENADNTNGDDYDHNVLAMVADNRRIISKEIPYQVKRKFRDVHIKDPFAHIEPQPYVPHADPIAAVIKQQQAEEAERMRVEQEEHNKHLQAVAAFKAKAKDDYLSGKTNVILTEEEIEQKVLEEASIRKALESGENIEVQVTTSETPVVQLSKREQKRRQKQINKMSMNEEG